MKRTKSILSFVKGVSVLLLLLLSSKFWFFRLDLTEDSRFTISPSTKATLKDLDQVVLIKVFLDGELPAGFKRLRSSIEETLEEFQVYAGPRLQYEFIDPSLVTDVKEKNKFLIDLAQKGIQPTNIFVKEDGKKTEKLVFPGALITFRGQEAAVMLLKGSTATDPNEILNESVENIEYELIRGIKKLSQDRKHKIAILSGHGEPDNIRFADLATSLKDFYDVKRADLMKPVELENYDAILVDQPTSKFAEEEVLKIDQYIMHGGKAIFLLDPIRIKIDSIQEQSSFVFPYDLNLDNLLYKYGVRMNKDLVQDLYCAQIPMTVGNLGDKPQIQLVPWTFFPILNNYASHPITKGLEALQAKFVSSLDTVKAAGVVKTPLVSTSEYTRLSPILGKIDLNQMRNDPDPKQFTAGVKTVAYLLEGRFKSPFVTLPLKKPQNYASESVQTSIMVMTDGDIALNELHPKNGQPLPLGYDPYLRRTYGNKDFLLHTFHYLLDKEGMAMSRTKEIQLRPLDKAKIRDHKIMYRILNIVLPPITVLLIWLISLFLQKRKYTHF